MSYIELLNKFWEQDRFNPFENVDTKLYLLLLDESNIRKWINPIVLHTYYLEERLRIKRKAIGEARNRLKQRGLIDFSAKTNNPTIYLIEDLEITNKEVIKLFPTRNNKETIGKQLGNNKETIGKQDNKDYIDNKTKEILSNESKKKNSLSISETLNLYKSQSGNENYIKFLTYLEENTPFVASHLKPLTEHEFEKLKSAYGSNAIRINLENIENRKDLRKNYSSLYRTLLNWCKNGYNC